METNIKVVWKPTIKQYGNQQESIMETNNKVLWKPTVKYYGNQH